MQYQMFFLYNEVAEKNPPHSSHLYSPPFKINHQTHIGHSWNPFNIIVKELNRLQINLGETSLDCGDKAVTPVKEFWDQQEEWLLTIPSHANAFRCNGDPTSTTDLLCGYLMTVAFHVFSITLLLFFFFGSPISSLRSFIYCQLVLLERESYPITRGPTSHNTSNESV